MLVHADEDLLHQVVGFLTVSHHADAEVVEPVLVGAHQQLEGVRVPPAQADQQGRVLTARLGRVRGGSPFLSDSEHAAR